jgi:hypothetical protein
MTSNSKFPLAKKRGRPLGSTNKRKVAKKPAKPAAKIDPFKQFDPAATLEKIRVIDSMLADQERKIINLEHQIVGYKAVISYLEHKVGTSK